MIDPQKKSEQVRIHGHYFILDLDYLLDNSVYHYIQSKKFNGLWPKKLQAEVFKTGIINTVGMQLDDFLLKPATFNEEVVILKQTLTW